MSFAIQKWMETTMRILAVSSPTTVYNPYSRAHVPAFTTLMSSCTLPSGGNVGFSLYTCSSTGRGAPIVELHRKRCSSSSIKSRATKDGDVEGAKFLDEDGRIKDMDGYLNHLSLEYDSVWDTKPAWCQPWTIGLTGVLVISGSWIVFHSITWTIIVTCLIGAWWYIFLYSYPQAYAEMIAERREKVKSGLEDTYGVRKIE